MRYSNRAVSSIIAALLLIAIVVAAAVLLYVFASALVSQFPVSKSTMITATQTVTSMPSTQSYTTTTTQVTITGTSCDLLFAQYQGGKEYKAWAFASTWVLMNQQQFMDAINYYQFHAYTQQRILYYGEIRIYDVAQHQQQGWESALYFFDNGAAVIYACP